MLDDGIDDNQPDGPLTPEEEEKTRLLTEADLKCIDERLLSHISHRWYKVARVVAMTMQDLQEQFPEIPDVFYSFRIRHLAEAGVIQAAGDLNRMRYSEVRRP